MGTLGIAAYAYLVGSLPAAYVVTRLVLGRDIRREGEGNAGARNVFHVVGRRWGALVLLLDLVKGMAVAVPLRNDSVAHLAVAGAFLVIGHGYPVWLRFVGGKGLAAAGGFGIGLMPWAGAIGSAVGLVLLAGTRRFLPSVVPAIVVMFLVAPVTGASWQTVAVALGAFLVVAAKRVADEPRMRRIEAETGWDRATGGVRS